MQTVKQIAILGRQPKISLAELEVLYSAQKIQPLGDWAAIVDSADPLPQDRLGGSIKTAKLLTRLENKDITGAFEYLTQSIPEHLTYLPEGKLQFGVSVYGHTVKAQQLLRQMLTLKKIIKKQGRSVRIVENKQPALEAATVLYNKLTSPLGWEILLIRDGTDTLIAQTTGVQNIDNYSKRDFDRPKRDAFNGMLPPKLAQIMINLTRPEDGVEILDPFCGTGVVLQEALLMGFATYGTDINERMVRYSRDNITWLQDQWHIRNEWYLETADATSHTWRVPIHTVVCETYLGQPLTALPNADKLKEITNEANTVAEGFLKNIAPQLTKGTRLCVAFPSWYLGNGTFKHLPVLDHLVDLGYNRLDFKHASEADLTYHREDQIVARELTVLEKQ